MKCQIIGCPEKAVYWAVRQDKFVDLCMRFAVCSSHARDLFFGADPEKVEQLESIQSNASRTG